MKIVRFRPAAEADLDAIWDYTVERWGVAQAVRYVDEVRNRVDGLGTGSTRHTPAPEIKDGIRRALAGRHMIYFREDGSTVTVLRILHQGMDPVRWID